jgi:PAS domain-containing protein
MWAVRILSGPQAGQIFMLKRGKNKFGRSADCDFQLGSSGISKIHFELTVFPDKIVLTDLKSSNGTYVNGTRVHHAIIRMGDRLAAHDVLFDVVMTASQSVSSALSPMRRDHLTAPTYHSFESKPNFTQPSEIPLAANSPIYGFVDKVRAYVDQVVMPALHRLVEVFEFQKVIFSFSLAFIILVTILSVMPLNQMTSDSISIESRRRALTVARALANANQRAIGQGDISSFRTDLILREDGIEDVYIVSREGSIIAPQERAGSAPKHVAFTREIKGQIKDFSMELSGGLIGASTPILSFDPELQVNTARAYVVVIYNPGSLKFDDGRALALFFQMLLISSLVGGVLFFLMYKLIEYPLTRLNTELDLALREGRDGVDLPILFPALQNLVVNVNSALTRLAHGGASAGGLAAGADAMNRETDFIQLIRLMGFPSLLINREGLILAMNENFEALTGISQIQMNRRPYTDFPDQALSKNIEALIASSQSASGQTVKDTLEISGHVFSLSCQNIGPDYYIITVSPADSAQGGAA